jgi:hydrogenase nickel incorporation protein HypA/HybF
MHEMGLALEIIDIAAASIPADLAGARVARVNLTVGKLSAVVPESLRFCFQVASRETAVEGAELHIEEVPVVARCHQCGNEWTIDTPVFRCPTCDSPRIKIVSGRELDIRSIELEEKEGD